MKKLLGILGTITIAGNGMTGIVGNAPVSTKNEVNYLFTNNLENLIRNKRESNIKDNIELIGHWTETYKRKNNGATHIIFLTPNFFEKLNQSYEYNVINQKWEISFDKIKNKIENKLLSDIKSWVGTDYDVLNMVVNVIKDNWNDINDVWQNSKKINRIGIYFKTKITHFVTGYMSGGSKIDNLKYISSFIMSEEAVLTNKHLDKFNEDFNNYSRNKTSIYNDKKINLGLIKKSSVYCILTRVKELHRNLDIFQFDVVEISEYSHFKEGFSAKLVVRGAPKVHNDMESRYPVGTKIELFFNTETQIGMATLFRTLFM